MNRLLLISFALITTQICGQSGFVIPEIQVIFTKDITFGTVHGYLEIESDTTDTMPMIWIARKEESMPSEWVVNFDDQTTYYPLIQTGITDTFDLIPNQAFNRKLIIGLAHNGVADTASVFFTVFPVDAQEDSVIIEYQFRIARSSSNNDTTDTIVTGIFTDQFPFENLLINAHRSEDWLVQLNRTVDQIAVYDLLGRPLGHSTTTNQLRLSSAGHSRCIIVLAIENGKTTSKKFIAID